MKRRTSLKKKPKNDIPHRPPGRDTPAAFFLEVNHRVYVWGTYGCVLTDSIFAYKLEQYPDGVGNYEDFIRANWLGGRTTDCVGLIKGYGWLNPETLSIDYATNGMPDIGANQMY